MAQPLGLSRVPLLFRHLWKLPSTVSPPQFLSISSSKQLSSSPYPLQYEMIVLLPPPPRPPRRLSSRLSPNSHAPDSPSFEDFLENRLNPPPDPDPDPDPVRLGKSKRKYLNKRRRKLLGSDSEDEEYRRAHADEMVELKPEVVEFETLHQREEELHSYDASASPWDKGKHYRMVYQLEKKYFPNQGFDKAFLHPGAHHPDQKTSKTVTGKAQAKLDQGFLPFQDKDINNVEDVKPQVSRKSVESMFKSVMIDPAEEAPPEPFLSSRRTGLPAKWDSPTGTVLLVNKPKGWTSFTVCGKLRHLVKVQKVGHAGTLDPMATGLLIVCVGKSTKIVDRFQGMTKGYSGIFRLGEATSTWDADSPVIQREPWEHIKDADLKKAAKSFCGEIWQVPPMFSAIKVGGEKMYEKARRGENIELSPRRVSIFQFDIERSLDDRQNLIFRVTCSKGTYIRSLCADLGKALGSCAHLTALRRDSIGEYLADDAWEFKELEEDIIKGYI